MLMQNVNEIFERTHIQKLRSFLIWETEADIEAKSYEERTEKPLQDVIDEIKKCVPDTGKQEYVIELLHTLTKAYEDAYIEIGMQAGARLMVQLLNGEVKNKNV